MRTDSGATVTAISYSTARAARVNAGTGLAAVVLRFDDGMFFFSSRRRHTRLQGDWSSDVCSSDLMKFSDLIAQGRSFTLKHLGKKTMGIMDSLTPFFLMVEAKKVFQYGQVLKYATQIGRASCRERV